jgi:hypothetical protein
VDWDAGRLGKWKYLWLNSTIGETLELVELPGDTECVLKGGAEAAVYGSNLSEGRSAEKSDRNK